MPTWLACCNWITAGEIACVRRWKRGRRRPQSALWVMEPAFAMVSPRKADVLGLDFGRASRVNRANVSAWVAIAATLVGVLALAGCGRKSGLDAPPYATAAEPRNLDGTPVQQTAPATFDPANEPAPIPGATGLDT